MVCLAVSDSKASIADTTCDNELASGVSETNGSDSVSAIITITWTTAALTNE